MKLASLIFDQAVETEQNRVKLGISMTSFPNGIGGTKSKTFHYILVFHIGMLFMATSMVSQ